MSTTAFALPEEVSLVKKTFEQTNVEYNTTYGVLPTGVALSHIQYAGTITKKKIKSDDGGESVFLLPEEKINTNIIITAESNLYNEAIKLEPPFPISARCSIPSSQENTNTVNLYPTEYNIINTAELEKFKTKAIESTITRIRDQILYLKQTDDKVNDIDNINIQTNTNALANTLYTIDELNQLLTTVTKKLEDLDENKATNH